jgi:hypothetical protein
VDIRAQQAAEHHQRAGQLEREAVQERWMRDELIIALRRDDPRTWSYTALARRIGCSVPLIASIARAARHPVPEARHDD